MGVVSSTGWPGRPVAVSAAVANGPGAGGLGWVVRWGGPWKLGKTVLDVWTRCVGLHITIQVCECAPGCGVRVAPRRQRLRAWNTANQGLHTMPDHT